MPWKRQLLQYPEVQVLCCKGVYVVYEYACIILPYDREYIVLGVLVRVPVVPCSMTYNSFVQYQVHSGVLVYLCCLYMMHTQVQLYLLVVIEWLEYKSLSTLSLRILIFDVDTCLLLAMRVLSTAEMGDGIRRSADVYCSTVQVLHVLLQFCHNVL